MESSSTAWQERELGSVVVDAHIQSPPKIPNSHE
jgi:hypothetical protein